jgi:hypothetical protein
MHTCARLLAVATLLIVAGAETASACGDKFVVFGRGVRFKTAYAAARPASVLLFLKSESSLSQIEREFKLQSTLKEVGHKPVIVESSDALEKAMRGKAYDIVLAAAGDVAAVEKARTAAGAKSSIIPALYKPTAEATKDAQRDYGCLFKVSKKNHDLLLVIDEVMRDRSKGAKDRCAKL